MVFAKHLRIDLQLDAENELFSLLGRLNAFRRELGLGSDKTNRRWDNIWREGVEDHACLVPEGKLTGLRRGQINRHIDIIQIENREDARPSIHDFPSPMDQVLNSAATRRDKRKIDQDRLDTLNLGLGALDRRLRCIALRFGGV